MRLLFVCAMNQWRSPTAERIYSSRPGVEVRSRGLRSGSRRRLQAEDLEWADAVFAMEASHARQLRREFSSGLGGTPIVVLDIPDEYRFMDPELVEAIELLVDPWLAGAEEARADEAGRNEDP